MPLISGFVKGIIPEKFVAVRLQLVYNTQLRPFGSGPYA